MAEFAKLDDEWNEWIKERPTIVWEMCKSHPPNKLYYYARTEHIVTIHGYSEDGTMIVNITGEYNLVTFDRQVFGIKPEELVECDFPEPGAELGTILTDPDEINVYIQNHTKGKCDHEDCTCNKSSPTVH